MAVDKSLNVGDRRQLLLPDANLQLEYRDGLRPAEAYATDFEVDHRFLCIRDDPKFEEAERKGVANGRQNMANIFGPKRDKCVLSKNPNNLVGYSHFAFKDDIQYDELTSSEQSGVDADKEAKASGRSITATKPQAKGSQGKNATQVALLVTTGLLGATSS